VTTIPSSSDNSRINVCSGRSPRSILPPGNSQSPRHLLAGRALRDEHAPVGVDEGAGGDKHEFFAHDPLPQVRRVTLMADQRRWLTVD
jgi:hypothetical protein